MEKKKPTAIDNGFLVLYDWLPALQELGGEEVKKLLLALIERQRNGTPIPKLGGMTDVFARMIEPTIKRRLDGAKAATGKQKQDAEVIPDEPFAQDSELYCRETPAECFEGTIEDPFEGTFAGGFEEGPDGGCAVTLEASKAKHSTAERSRAEQSQAKLGEEKFRRALFEAEPERSKEPAQLRELAQLREGETATSISAEASSASPPPENSFGNRSEELPGNPAGPSSKALFDTPAPTTPNALNAPQTPDAPQKKESEECSLSRVSNGDNLTERERKLLIDGGIPQEYIEARLVRAKNFALSRRTDTVTVLLDWWGRDKHKYFREGRSARYASASAPTPAPGVTSTEDEEFFRLALERSMRWDGT